MNYIKIDSIDDPRIELFKNKSEVELLRYNEPALGYFMAESVKCVNRALSAGYEAVAFLLEDSLVSEFDNENKEYTDSAASCIQSDTSILKMLSYACDTTPIYIATHEVLLNITGYNLTGGCLCLMKRRELPSLEEICKGARRIVVLDDIENPTNVGAIFRSAAALNVDAVILNSACSDPLYRRASRVSMGTVFKIPWTIIENKKSQENPGNYIDMLHTLGFKTAAMALTDDCVDIKNKALNSEEKLAIIMGNEGNGLSDEIIAQSDYTVCIPMTHGVDSLNVAAASAVAFWQLCN